MIINEVAWAGTTAALTSDEWIELYNPGASPVNLAGWVLKSPDGTPTIALTGTIPADGFFLLERTDDTTVSDIAADQIYSGDLGNSNEILQLLDPSNRLIDSANSNSGFWPAGSSITFGSMERRTGMTDGDFAWITNTGVVRNGLNANGGLILGTPKNLNWAVSVTPTATATPTRTRTPLPPPTRTPIPTLPPQPRVAINEFVPRPGHDWNNNGVVNVEDEYIEIINHGTIDVNLGGYSLDDEVNIGSSPYSLPSVTLSPGERMVFYGSETGLLLSDGGDGVRLLKPNGQLMDAYNYFVVRFPDQSYCRLPDNGGADDWNTNCFPTPGLQNALSGSS
ncbi:MAG: lamin tail domain-containing protein, partial [Anaerolineae bacterium]|nr:lamin tail domain-containing protein [Anaerolineae bacterium]